ncbi:hypothetical protein KIW84_058171 [Lathyrus oleraceus]|uniref:Uncharacterized protein n=1 Tax=Pisum sativum TaxID=3888 RepID=A0A9D4X495_PEA|nr:hypothetical protein KIW84_058171 [Pisum sativum]
MVESYILISDDELDISYNVSPDRQHSGNISLAKYFAGQKGKDLDHNPAQNNKNLDFCKDVLFHSNTKRKRSYNVVMSESESVHNDDEVEEALSACSVDPEVIRERSEELSDARGPVGHWRTRYDDLRIQYDELMAHIGELNEKIDKHEDAIHTQEAGSRSIHAKFTSLVEFYNYLIVGIP